MFDVSFEPISANSQSDVSQNADATVFQTLEWQNFLRESIGVSPVSLDILAGSELVGRFTGAVTKKYGVAILGSPFPGWTTSYMGFNLYENAPISRLDLLLSLKEYAFRQLHCMHLEVMDRNIGVEEAKSYGFTYRPYTGFEIDLTKGEEDLFDAMSSACRRCVRKAEKSGVIIENADDEAFADDYYSQFTDVFKKQKLSPPYGKERVLSLIRTIGNSGNLLLLRARNQEGVCIASGIFPALNDTMYFWGGASFREHQQLRPNEILMWSAMKYWKNRGIQKFDMGGAGEYKRKYGGYEIAVPWIRISKYPGMEFLRSTAEKLIKLKMRFA